MIKQPNIDAVRPDRGSPVVVIARWFAATSAATVAAVFAVGGGGTASAETIQRIWLTHGRSDPSHLTVHWATDRPGESTVQFGVMPNELTTIRQDGSTTLHHVEIPIDQPDATYHYRVATGDQRSGDLRFRSYPTDRIRIAVVANWQGRPDLSAILRDEVDLFVTAGDNIGRLWGQCDPGDADCIAPYLKLIDAYPHLFQTTPILPTLGNHDREIRPRGSSPPADPVYDIDATAFCRFFDLPGDRWKWHFDLSPFDLRLIALDLNHTSDVDTTWQSCHPFDALSDQCLWYERLMDRPSPFTLTIYNERNVTVRGLAGGKWGRLFDRGTACISGFGYFGERAQIDGVTYFNTSLNGRGDQYPDPHSTDLFGRDNYVLVTVPRDGPMTLQLKSLDGEPLRQQIFPRMSRPEKPMSVAPVPIRPDR